MILPYLDNIRCFFLTSYIYIDQDFSLLNKNPTFFWGKNCRLYFPASHLGSVKPWRHVWRRLCLDGYDLWGFSAETRSWSADFGWVGIPWKIHSKFAPESMDGKGRKMMDLLLDFQGRCDVSFREGSIWRISDFLYFVGGVLSENFQSLGLELRFLFWMYPAGNQHILF